MGHSVVIIDKVAEVVQKNSESIMSKVLCNEVVYGSMDGYSKEWNINGEKVTLGVKKVD